MQASRNVDWSLLYSCQSRVDNFLFCSKSGHVLYIMQARWNAQTDPCHSLFSSPTVSQGMSYILCRQAGTQGPILAPLVKARLTFSSPTVSQDMSYILCRQAWTQGPILATLVKAGLTFSEAYGRWVSQYFLPKLRRLLYFLFFFFLNLKLPRTLHEPSWIRWHRTVDQPVLPPLAVALSNTSSRPRCQESLNSQRWERMLAPCCWILEDFPEWDNESRRSWGPPSPEAGEGESEDSFQI